MNSKYIKIPDLTKIKTTENFLGKDLYYVYEVLPFFLENNNLYYFRDNTGTVKDKIRCIKNYDNKYKIFAYKTTGRLSHTKYFILDVSKQEISLASSGDCLPFIKEWLEYLLAGGTLEEALELKKIRFNPADGI